jgi:plastocyanin domain-containing protein
MTRTLAIIPAIALLAVAACNKSGSHEGHDHASHSASEAVDTTQRIIPVSVDDRGFQPSRVELKKGQDATLRFTRTSDDTCAKKVVFPELKIEKDLPLNQAVDVKVPTDQPRKLAFQCGMGMFKSAVVIN